MRQGKLNIKSALFIFLMMLPVIPFFQSRFSLLNVGKLEGAFLVKPKGELALKNWFSGNYQSAAEEYVNENFGFRNFMVRLNNQIAFSFFNKANADNIVIGKNNFLYQRPSLNACNGRDFLGKDFIKGRIEQLKFISDTLAKLNKNLIVIFGTGKGTFYPENIPDEYNKSQRITNIEYYTELAKSYGLNYLDFNKHFIDLKKSSKYPLYPQYGIHWSRYGGFLVTDSLIHYIESLRQIDMPDIILDSVSIRQPENEDYDIAGGMNLLFRLKSFNMAYPEFHYESDSGQTKPSALVIGDSFFWGLSNMEISKAFSRMDFWLYNKRGTAGALRNLSDEEKLAMAKEAGNYDVVIIIGTDWNLPDLGWGFIENTFAYYKGINLNAYDEIVFQQKVLLLKQRIMQDEFKMERIREMAKKENISVDSMLTLRAVMRVRNER